MTICSGSRLVALMTLTSAGIGFEEDRMSAWNTEVGYTFDFLGKETTLAAGYQGTDNGMDFLPERRFLSMISVGIFHCTTLSLEYLNDKYENGDKGEALTTQLAIEF